MSVWAVGLEVGLNTRYDMSGGNVADFPSAPLASATSRTMPDPHTDPKYFARKSKVPRK
jgi:hypothetical protein